MSNTFQDHCVCPVHTVVCKALSKHNRTADLPLRNVPSSSRPLGMSQCGMQDRGALVRCKGAVSGMCRQPQLKTGSKIRSSCPSRVDWWFGVPGWVGAAGPHRLWDSMHMATVTPGVTTTCRASECSDLRDLHP